MRDRVLRALPVRPGLRLPGRPSLSLRSRRPVFAPSSSGAFGVAETVELARSLGRLPRYLVAYLVEGEQFGAGVPLSLAVAEAVEDVADRIVSEILRKLKAKGKRLHA